MKKQVILIHGGDVHHSRKEFIEALKKSRPSREDFVHEAKGWKDVMAERLGPDYEVLYPEMPHWGDARYEEWKIWFEKLLAFVGNGPVFVGHSLGGIFLARYFAENADEKQARGVFLVAAPYGTGPADDLADFVLPKDLSRLEKLGPRLRLYASEDDPVVSFKDFQMYSKLLPQATAIPFEDKGHFRLEEFPEIVADIRDAFGDKA